jgi:hypothetical protein
MHVRYCVVRHMLGCSYCLLLSSSTPIMTDAEFSYRALCKLMVFYDFLILGIRMWFCFKMPS